ncbi:pentatricopeptide repeat-containing protein [Canna indica]|uniref:Pentatricopeptide repeat-containing protein n=1 Tax=Canna indica TaxID=4628 RepID=A0AAQ3JMW6_9LILI|nr:pentatricopeptide repeat-containing protein [Canna indica]
MRTAILFRIRQLTLSHFFTSFASCSRAQFALGSRLAALSRSGDHSGLLSLFLRCARAREQPAKPDGPIYLVLLRAAAALSSRATVLSLHAHIAKSGHLHDVVVNTALVDALSKCSDAGSARKLFDEMPARDTAAWNVMLSGCARSGDVEQAVCLASAMRSSGVTPNVVTLSVLLQVYGGLTEKKLGQSVHAYAVRHLQLMDTFLVNSLIVYYNKSGNFHTSERIFERMLRRDIVSWNAMMAGYAQSDFGWRALELFNLMRKECQPDLFTLETALHACALVGSDAIDGGLAIHGLLVKLRFQMDVHGENSLLLFYCKCRLMEDGQTIFDRMGARNIVSWNILVDGYVQIRRPGKVLNLAKCISFNELGVSSDLLVCTLQAARQLGSTKHIMCIHGLVMVMGFSFDTYINSSLIAAYGDCGKIILARKTLDYLVSETSNVTACWNSMLSIHVKYMYFSEALELVSHMHANECIVDAVTLVNILSVSTELLNLRLGKAVHGFMIRNKHDFNVFATTALLEHYAECGTLTEACYLFLKIPIRNRVTWNTMIHCFVHNGFPQTALKLFYLMQEQDNFVPDATSIVGVIEAISQRGYEEEKNYIHKYAIESGFIDDEYVANSLIAMHASVCNFDNAITVFERTSKLSVVTWNTLISGYANHGLVNKATSVFYFMKSQNVAPDLVTFLCLIRASTTLGSLNCLTQIHTIICKEGYESNLLVGTSLVYGYAKCGDLIVARLIFDGLKYRSTVTWNSMIQGYGMHGNAEEVHELFSQMQQSGIVPTVVTFLNIISACSHVGDVEKGQYYFDLMRYVYSLIPNRDHLCSLIDLLGRRGLLKEAHETLEKSPLDPGLHAWGALLGACRIQGDLEVGLTAANKILELDPLHYGYNLLLSNMHAEVGRWTVASEIRNNIDKMGLKKVNGWTMIESFS